MSATLPQVSLQSVGGGYRVVSERDIKLMNGLHLRRVYESWDSPTEGGTLSLFGIEWSLGDRDSRMLVVEGNDARKWEVYAPNPYLLVEGGDRLPLDVKQWIGYIETGHRVSEETLAKYFDPNCTKPQVFRVEVQVQLDGEINQQHWEKKYGSQSATFCPMSWEEFHIYLQKQVNCQYGEHRFNVFHWSWGDRSGTVYVRHGIQSMSGSTESVVYPSKEAFVAAIRELAAPYLAATKEYLSVLGDRALKGLEPPNWSSNGNLQTNIVVWGLSGLPGFTPFSNLFVEYKKGKPVKHWGTAVFSSFGKSLPMGWAIVTCATAWSDTDWEVVERFVTEKEAEEALRRYDNSHEIQVVPWGTTYLSSVTGKWI